MMKPTVFFSRCKPRGFDAIDIALKHNVAFAGWPVWLRETFDRTRVRDCILDLNAPADVWASAIAGLGRTQRSMATQNRNLAAEIAPGSILLIPRPSRGLIYAGRVERRFELVNDPAWADEYAALVRPSVPLEQIEEHISDVVQCWSVDRFRPVPVPAIPAWIRRSLFGRSTLGRVNQVHSFEIEPFVVLDKIIDSPGRIAREWTIDLAEVESRLITDIGPNAFEHLSVALLQLEHPDQIWAHVGGSGDGGVDGIAADVHGDVCGILQCKWAYWGEDLGLVASTTATGEPGRIILTSLLHAGDVKVPDGVEFLGRRDIAQLVRKHAERLPQALSLRVGQRQPQEAAN